MASETVQVLQLQGAVRTGDVQSFLTALRAKWEQLGSSSYRAIQYDLKVSFSEVIAAAIFLQPAANDQVFIVNITLFHRKMCDFL